MSSAVEFKQQHENEAFTKATEKVVSALSKEPLGLQISQIMTICRLSNKTVLNILKNIDVYQNTGFWILKLKNIEKNKSGRNI